MPYSDSASTTAFITAAGREPAQPASPRTVWHLEDWLLPAPVIFDSEHYRIRGTRQRVISKRSGLELPLFVEHGALHQCPADPLHAPDMRLTRYEQWIHDDPEIVDHRVFDDRNDPGFRVDLNLGDMTPIREGRGRAFVNMLHIE